MALLIKQHRSLKAHNTFGVDVLASEIIEIHHEADLTQLYLQRPNLKAMPTLVLGGGSNILFTKDFDGLVIHMKINGIQHVIQDNKTLVTAGAGVVWNDLVWYCVDNGFGGIENMALIPGTVGASPIQNIGAYGTELQDVFISCRAFDTYCGAFTTFEKADCKFAYRDSLFKNEAKGRYIITAVTIGLIHEHRLNTTYGAIQMELSKRNIGDPTIRDIASVVSTIRTEKLPDPSTIGNAGSFFKNPIISVHYLKQLQSLFPDRHFVHYPVDDEHVKIAAGWLIEQCGWKGKQVGNVGTWKNQALVLVNHKNASGTEIYALSEQIIQDVNATFGIILEREVNIL